MKKVALFKMLFIALAVIFSSCEDKDDDVVVGCLELSFESIQENSNAYIFKADFDNNEDFNYEWYINGEFIENPNQVNPKENDLSWQFNEKGTYEVCIKLETPDCPKGASFCQEIVIDKEVTPTTPKGCPEMDFNRDGDYLFADFEGIEELEFYHWQTGTEVLELEGTENEGDNKLSLKDLKDGTYEICLWTEGPDCTGARFCKEVVIGDKSTPPSSEDCPDLSFTRDGNYLYADFEGIDNIDWYDWNVNSEFVEKDGVKSNGDNKLSLENLKPGTYSICITTESAVCTLATFCKGIVIE